MHTHPHRSDFKKPGMRLVKQIVYKSLQNCATLLQKKAIQNGIYHEEEVLILLQFGIVH